MTEDDRTEILGAAPLAVGKHREDDPLGGLGVVDPDDREGRGRRTGLLVLAGILAVALIALIGVFLYQLNGGGRPTQVAVPPVAGQTLNDAQAQLTVAKLQSRTNNVPDATVPPNTVIRTDPTVGTSVNENSIVQLYVSTGPQQVQVPTVANLTLADATTALTAAKLTVAANPAMAPSDTVPAGSVISSTPAAGASADLNSAVALVVSSGVQPVRIPSVIGQTQADATANLDAAGFKVVPAPADSAKAKGEVIAQNPPGGGNAPKGTAITLNISSGNRIVMPDLTGLTAAEVLPKLQASQYTGGQGNVTATAVPVTDLAKNGLVVSQSVPPTTEIEPNAPISVGFGSFNPIPVTTTTTPPTTTPKPPGG